MWPDTRLTELLNIEHPILQAPMLGSCTPELATAVSAAGGLGAHACGALPLPDVEKRLRAVGQMTNAPVNFNFFVLEPENRSPDPEYLKVLEGLYAEHDLGALPELPAEYATPGQDIIEALVAARPRVVSFNFGLPAPEAIAQLKEAGILLLCSATNVREAIWLEAQGVDAIIAQGYEAGGHRGSFKPTHPGDGVGTLALVPQVVDAVSVPVIAAGGIADARGIVAAMVLGASGVQMGTLFLACPEAATDDARRAKIANASADDTMFTDAVSGRAARAARSDYAEAMAPWALKMAPFLQQYALSGPLRNAGAAPFDLYGQAAALARAEPARDVVTRLAAEAQALFASLSQGRPDG